MREPLYPHFHIYEIASRKSLFTQRRGETVLKVPEGSTTQLQGQPKQCFSAHFGLRIQATSTLRASLAPFSDSLGRGVLGSSLAGSCIERPPKAARTPSLAPRAARAGTTCSGGA